MQGKSSIMEHKKKTIINRVPLMLIYLTQWWYFDKYTFRKKNLICYCHQLFCAQAPIPSMEIIRFAFYEVHVRVSFIVPSIHISHEILFVSTSCDHKFPARYCSAVLSFAVIARWWIAHQMANIIRQQTKILYANDVLNFL